MCRTEYRKLRSGYANRNGGSSMKAPSKKKIAATAILGALLVILVNSRRRDTWHG